MSKVSTPKKQKPILITGFMASGKSTMGRILAKELGRAFIDLDAWVEHEAGKSIIEIFREEGEKSFREQERSGLLQLLETFDGVLALGGGALQHQEVVDAVKNKAVLIFIETKLEEICERVANSKNRPILFGGNGEIKPKQVLFDELKTLYLEREIYYRQAHISLVSGDFPQAAEMAKAAITKLKAYG